MQFRKMMLVLTALGAMSGFMVGCGDDDKGSDTCTTNADCAGTEICHPTSNVCVATCSTGSDCPDTAKTCAPLGSGPDAAKLICQCGTDVLCNGGPGSSSTDLVCSIADKVCVKKCSSNADCSTGRTCNTGSGQCEQGGGGPPPGGTCTGEAQSTCSYGQFCSTGTCATPAAPTCPNLQGKPAASFDPATGTGNIIYNVTKEIFGTACGADTTAQTVKARVSFYAKSGTLPTSKEGLNGFFYVRTNGSELNGVPLSNGYERSADGKSASLSVNLCTSAGESQIVLGFYFTGGNGYCATLTK